MNTFSWSTFAGLSPAAAEPPALGRFVFLSLLLHFLLIVLFGNTTGTGTAPGAYLSMPLGVRLRPLSAESGAGLTLAPAPEASSLGAALLRTLTGAKQQPAPRPRTQTRPAPTVPQRPAANRVEAAPESPPAAQPTRDAAPPAQAPPVDPQPGLNFSAPEVIDRPLKPSSISPPPVERPPAPPVDLPARDVPVLPPAPIERVIAPKIEQPIVPPTAPAPREVPRTPAPAAERIAPRTIEPAPLPAPAPPPREVPAVPTPPVAPPKLEPPAPPVEAPPRPAPAIPAAPVERVEPPRLERTVTPPVEVPKAPAAVTPAQAPVERIAPPEIAPAIQPAPRPVPATTPAPVERVAPPSSERAITPPVEQSVRDAPAAPATAPTPAPTPAATSSAPTAPAAPAAPATPTATPAAAAPAPSGRDTGTPADPSPRTRVGTPDGRDDIFRPRPDTAAPAAPPGAAPRLNLDAVRQRAREIATEGSGSRGLLPLQIPVPAERKSRLAEGIEKAIKPDCRNAYADMGLLAVPALVAGAVADVGCRW
ncbi:MAG: hypothetical protein KAX84_13310 [Burkholderiales bacterium]|nr:hypothetical protein [Burkholderiales bacterium]